MAAVTPVTTKSTAGYVDPHNGIYGGAVTDGTTSLVSNGTHHANRADLKETIWYFTAIGVGDTWTSNIPGIVAVFWQPDIPDTDRGAAVLTDADTGTITFSRGGAAADGWLLVKSRG